MAEVVCLEQADTVLGTDAASFVSDIVKDEWLQSAPNLLGSFHIIVPFHHGVQMQVAVGDVAVTEDSSA